MKAAWDWHLPRETDPEQRALVEFVHAVGFDTLIIRDPTEAMVERAHALDVRVLAVVSPNATEESTCLQRMRPAEEEMAEALARTSPPSYQERTFRWFPVFQSRLLCYEQQAAVEMLKDRVGAALRLADGVALDGFGFRNHYACFCDSCQPAGEPPLGILYERAEDTLVRISARLYDHAQATRPGALVINHVWPPFRPNPNYGARLRLDFCSQTISWFYRPVWSLERVELEAQEHKRLQDPATNTFVPFIGLFDNPDQLRPPERIRDELAIAREYGDGHVVFSTLGAVKAHDDIREVVQQALRA